MIKKYKEYKYLDIQNNETNILQFWKENSIFCKSIYNKTKNSRIFSFLDGPPSINGLPGIHHVVSRVYKDIFCRYKTMQGYIVYRKAGWDSHGLPVELKIEKELKINKYDIPDKISIAEYCNKCYNDVISNIKFWKDLTVKMGYWIDIENSYNTCNNSYIESVWNIIKILFNKKLIYKGYKIQPYSPCAGTGLSFHELNQLGSYKVIKDTSLVVKFKIIFNEKYKNIFIDVQENIYLLVWTTTPWTLPANSAIAINKYIKYVKIQLFDKINKNYISVILSKNQIYNYFNANDQCDIMPDYYNDINSKNWKIICEYDGYLLLNLKYEQLMPYIYNDYLLNNAFYILHGNFVNDNTGTGIVHIAPMFGIDDYKLCIDNNIPMVGVKQNNNKYIKPIVDLKGRFIKEIQDFAGQYVRSEYSNDNAACSNIINKLCIDNKIFTIIEYEHLYPHCWRTDKPILYYPMESWFIKTTAMKDKIMQLSQKINWIPKQVGQKRFYDWLNNIVDWNFSRSRFWGTPLPIWQDIDNQNIICIGSVNELKKELEYSINANILKEKDIKINKSFLDKINNNNFNLHKPYVDNIILIKNNKKLYRENDVVDVWLDSGCAPYGQIHYPFENNTIFKKTFPVDFISEGIDQTRGWFFTLHVISVMINESIAFKNVIPHGLVLDKYGNKMSKKYGNSLNPFNIINEYGADILRWYIISNSLSSDNIKFDLLELKKIRNKFFGTLHNIYSFFALYANIDNFIDDKFTFNIIDSPIIDKWIISELNLLIKNVTNYMNKYDSYKTVHIINNFVIQLLSNWYVRICRRRFWKSEYTKDKISAYKTLYMCLYNISLLLAPIIPFYSEIIYKDLIAINPYLFKLSVHLNNFPCFDKNLINLNLNRNMRFAKDIVSIVLSLRKKANINVKTPLQTIMILPKYNKYKSYIDSVKDIILFETNVKTIKFVNYNNKIFVKKAKPKYKVIGPIFGKKVKYIINIIDKLTNSEITKLEIKKFINIIYNNKNIKILYEYVDIVYNNTNDWNIGFSDNFAIALDINLNTQLKEEGLLRDLISKIQLLRKKHKLKITDRISIKIANYDFFYNIINKNYNYICNELLCDKLLLCNKDQLIDLTDEVLINNINILIQINHILK